MITNLTNLEEINSEGKYG